jgi:hypothetical protein
MNDDWESFYDACRRDESHPPHIARHGAEARHRPDVHEGSPTGDVVCCICWGHAADADACHQSHRVPGVPLPADCAGCCPAHHIRSQFWIETQAPVEQPTRAHVPPRAVAGRE